MKAKKFDTDFTSGKDVIAALDLSSALGTVSPSMTSRAREYGASPAWSGLDLNIVWRTRTKCGQWCRLS